MDTSKLLSSFFAGKSEHSLMLSNYFVSELEKIGPVSIHPHKTMVAITNVHKRVAYITQAGKNFVHIVFPFRTRYDNNFCFQKIQQVPGRRVIYHHFRMLQKEDVNDEVRGSMRVAYNGEAVV